jgi:hypothetical protein
MKFRLSLLTLMVVFLIPAGLASYAASRLLLLKLGVVFWH